MNIFVRSHMSALEPDQVAAVRVRWEREKRKAAEAPAPKRSRRKAAVEAPAPAPAEAKPARRRRTAAEVAEQEAKAAAEAEEEAAKNAFEIEPLALEAPPISDIKPGLSIEERARLLFKDVPAGTGASRGGSAAGGIRRSSRGPGGPGAGSGHAAAAPGVVASQPAVHPAARAAPRPRQRRPSGPAHRSAGRPSASGLLVEHPGTAARSAVVDRCAGPHLRSRCPAGWRAQEGKEVAEELRRPGSGAGEHPEDDAGTARWNHPQKTRATNRAIARSSRRALPRRRN